AKPVRRLSLYSMISKAFGVKENFASLPVNESQLDDIVSLDILVAEDNRINQKMILKLLNRMGHQTTLAEDGNEAVLLALKKEYDVIFMDMQMPNKDGIEATIELITGGCKSPIVAVTASALEEDKKRCLEVGMVDYISKPIVRKEIHRILKKYTLAKSGQQSRGIPKILIAEDEEASLILITKIVKKFVPLSVIKTATDGIEASAILGGFHPDLMITDVLMPNMNGFDLMKYIESDDKYKNLEVIVLSSLDKDEPMAQQIMAMRQVNYMCKPFESSELVDLLKLCLY
ncbi:response regulator, partial [bacterium]|nr:response regulator [bacterium]